MHQLQPKLKGPQQDGVMFGFQAVAHRAQVFCQEH